jgi:transglutaminase-like putative cysteine protease
VERRRVRVGCDFRFEAEHPVAAVFIVRPHSETPVPLLSESWRTDPEIPWDDFADSFGNQCRRTIVDKGTVAVAYDAIALTPRVTDPVGEAAIEHPVEELPGSVLAYTLPSRYCLSDVLSEAAWDLFGAEAPGWGRVQTISDWVHDNITFSAGSSDPLTTAADVFERRTGVCRDFAQLAITFCRALNIPARYVFGYLPDIDVPPAAEPMDFCAWIEVYLGGAWWTFDPRNNARRTGRVLIGRGRDAVDVAMVTSYGPLTLREMKVWADDADDVTQAGPAEDD